jgi:type III secretory pathway component EscV
MSTTNSLFSNNEVDSNNQTELSGEDALKLLVGDGAKYKTIEDLAKGMVHGQAHITKLETEATTLNENAQKQTSIDEILAAINADKGQQQHTEQQEQTDQSTQQPDTVDIATQIKNALAEQAQTTNAQDNIKKVTDSLGKSLGVRADEVYSRVGKDLGVNLDELSKTAPDAVIRLCTGQQSAVQQQGDLTQSQHSAALTQQTLMSELTQTGIQELYAKGGMTREQKFTLEMNNAVSLGDKFFDKK